MSSTRVIRPNSFRIETRIKADRPTQLPTPAKFRADTGVFQDIGSKLVRPSSRKEKSWLARSKGLRTSAGLEQQLIKEEGIKIRIGDKTLSQLLEVEVPETRKQEYIKDDGSIGVRQVPVLDAMGNPVLVKKVLTIPGTIEYFQKSIKEKLAEISVVLLDQTKTIQEKSDTIAILLMGALGSASVPTSEEAKSMAEFAAEVKIPEDPIAAGLSTVGLAEGRFAPLAYVAEHQSELIMYLLRYAGDRGLPLGQVIFDVNNIPRGIGEVRPEMFFDRDGNPRVLDILTSRVLPSAFERIEGIPPSPEAKLEEEPFGAFGEEEEEELPGLQAKSERVGMFLFDNFTLEQHVDVNRDDFNASSEPDQLVMLQAIVASREEVEEKEIIIKSDEAKEFLKDIPMENILIILENRGIGIDEYNLAGPAEEAAIAETINAVFFPPPEVTLEDAILETDTTISASDLESIKSIMPKLKNIQKLTFGQMDYLREIVDDLKENKIPTWKGDTLSDMETKMGLTVSFEELSTEQLITLVKLRNLPDETFMTFTQSEELEEEEEEVFIPATLESFTASLPEDEQKTMNSLIGKGLKPAGDEGKITLPNQQKASLGKFLSGSPLEKPSATAMRNLNMALFDGAEVIENLSRKEKALLTELDDRKIIRGGGKKTLEGRGHKMSMVYHMGSKYGYTRPHYSLQQQMRVC